MTLLSVSYNEVMFVVRLDKKYIKEKGDDGLREVYASDIRDMKGKKHKVFIEGQRVILPAKDGEPKQKGTIC